MKLNLDAKSPPKCKNCGRDKGNHKADTMGCPWGLSRTFPHFRSDQFYEPRPARKRKP